MVVTTVAGLTAIGSVFTGLVGVEKLAGTGSTTFRATGLLLTTLGCATGLDGAVAEFRGIGEGWLFEEQRSYREMFRRAGVEPV
jgi:hypothetical protein